MVSSILFCALIGALVALIVVQRKQQNWFGNKLSALTSSTWFQNPWTCGIIVFLFNMFLFGGVVAIVVGSVLLVESAKWPVPLPVIAVPAVTVSMLGWAWFGTHVQGPFLHRVKVAVVGSGFYWVLFAVLYWQLSLLPPDGPNGEDNFMAGIGLMMGMAVAVTAGMLCLLLIGWPRRNKQTPIGI